MNSLRLSLFLCLLLLACSTPRSFISHGDAHYFGESPKIVNEGERYFLRWRYANGGTGLFYMFSESRIEAGKLVFYISASTSTGDTRGRLQLEPITTAAKIELVKKNLAYWKNPDGVHILLNVEPASEEDKQAMQNPAGRGH